MVGCIIILSLPMSPSHPFLLLMVLFVCDSFFGILIQTYQHAGTVIQSLVEEDINVKFLVQLDKLIHLLETPTFAYLRLQVSSIGCSFMEIHALMCCSIWVPASACAFTRIYVVMWI